MVKKADPKIKHKNKKTLFMVKKADQKTTQKTKNRGDRSQKMREMVSGTGGTRSVEGMESSVGDGRWPKIATSAGNGGDLR
jgi:hypothetical protein